MSRPRPTPVVMTASEAAALLGRLGGMASKGKTSVRKATASRANGRRGGRPRKRR